MADLLTVFLDISWLVLIINLFLGPITIITHTWEPPRYLWLNLRLTWNDKPKTQTGTFSWGTAWQVSVHHTATADVTLKKTEGHFDAAFIWLAEGSHENMWILERSWVSGHSAERWDTWPTFLFSVRCPIWNPYYLSVPCAIVSLGRVTEARPSMQVLY